MSNQVKRRIISVLNERGSIESTTNTLNAVCNAARVSGSNGRDTVLGVLDSLEREGKAAIERDDNGYIKRVSHVKPRRAHMDRTEMSPQQKRERTFAKGVPSYLPDYLVTPVVITYKSERNQEVDAVEASRVSRYMQTRSDQEELSLALTALQVAGLECGNKLTSKQAHQVIVDALHCGAGTAGRRLKKLVDLRVVTVVGRTSAVRYTADPAASVTEAMLRGPVDEVVRESSSHDPVAESVSIQPELKLLEIITALEHEREELRRDNQKLATDKVHLAGFVADLQGQLEALRADVEALKAHNEPVIAPEVAEVLRRYGK